MNFNITAPFVSCPYIGDQKSSVTNPQSATPTSSIALTSVADGINAKA
jgi:hypothetical protein